MNRVENCNENITEKLHIIFIYLLLEANKRMETNEKTSTFDSVMKELGISESELLNAGNVEIE